MSSTPDVPAGTGSGRIRCRVPLPLSGRTGTPPPDLVTFSGLGEDDEHVALVWGPVTGPPLVRIHSECLTGDVFGSARCDCGPQLGDALELLARENGILLYLRQEGRGIGLYRKVEAYSLQDQGLDTVDANRELSLPADGRDYGAAARMLRSLGHDEVRLLTNNPAKVAGLESGGVRVVGRVPTRVFAGEHNHEYLETKRERMGHLLPEGELSVADDETAHGDDAWLTAP